MTPYEPHTCDSPQNYELDSMYNSKDLNILLKGNDVTNDVADAPTTNILNKKTKTTTINEINNVLLTNTIVV